MLRRSMDHATYAPALARLLEEQRQLFARNASDRIKHFRRLAARRQAAELIANVVWRQQVDPVEDAIARRLRSNHVAIELLERIRFAGNHFTLCGERECTPAREPRIVAAHISGEPPIGRTACLALVTLATCLQLR